jgi:hypothetical protein
MQIQADKGIQEMASIYSRGKFGTDTCALW